MRPSAIILGASLALSCNSKPAGGGAATTGGADGPAPSAGAATARPSSGPPEQAPGAGVGAPASASAAPGASSPPPAASTSASARGLAAPGNDTEAVALIRRILRTCKWERGKWADRCAPLDEWGEWSMLGLHTGQKTILALCEDDDLRVRQLCSMSLGTSVSTINDPPQATALLDAFEKERDPVACRGMARAVAHIRVEKAGSEDRVKQAARGYPIAECRAALLKDLLSSNDSLYDLIVDVAKTDRNPDARAAAASGLRSGLGGKPEREKNNCQVWLAMLDERVQPFTGNVAWMLAETPACTDQWDAMLQRFEALVTAGDVQFPMGQIPCSLHNQKRAKPEQKTRVIEIAKKLVGSDRGPVGERISALQCVAGVDPDGKAFAARFADSPDKDLKSAALKLTAASPSASGSGQAATAAASGSARGAAPSP